MQLAQSLHAAIDFGLEHPALHRQWHRDSNYICDLSVKNEEELRLLSGKANDLGIKLTTFREPDLNHEVTAIALAPSEGARCLCSSLPLALRQLQGETS